MLLVQSVKRAKLYKKRVKPTLCTHGRTAHLKKRLNCSIKNCVSAFSFKKGIIGIDRKRYDCNGLGSRSLSSWVVMNAAIAPLFSSRETFF